MNVLIIEDEPLIAQRLLREVRAFFGARLGRVVHCDDLDDVGQQLAAGDIDLALLDLNLYGEDGFKLFERIAPGGPPRFQTIIVSAHADRALTAFEHGVLDFVAKPFSQERLAQAFQRFLDQQAGGAQRAGALLVKRLGGIELLPFEQISHIQADGHYSKVIVCDGTAHFHDKSLDKILATLPPGFLRVHRSYAVNMQHFKRLGIEAGGKYFVDTAYCKDIPVSRALYPAVRALISGGR